MAVTKAKYRVCDVAKDLNIKSAEIIAIVQKYAGTQKKAQTALEDFELDILFDYFTKQSEVESFDDYFAATGVNKDNAAPAAQQEQQSPADAGAKEKENSAKNKPSSAASEKAKSQNPAAFKSSKPFEKHQKQESETHQTRTKGERKTVNTRQSNVDLDKYNEKYMDMSESAKLRDKDSTKKQKINQKSRNYRKNEMGSKRETEQQRLARIQAEREKKHIKVEIGEEITVGELAALIKVTATEVIKKLFSYGIMANINQVIDYDTAEIVATELGAEVSKQVVVTIEERIIDDSEDKEEDLVLRSPVVCVMGHVDHGKTSILDAIRHTNVISTESGGITQHIGAYRVKVGDKLITFLDTPGHEAFTAMRARGAMATDIAVLVVAADDGIMPQTIEAIHHAKAAGVSIIVAINKMDKPGVSTDRIMQQLTEHELLPEEWGGDVICVPVSAKTGMNLDKLLESILLVAEMKELKANPNRAAKGIVIEARIDKGRGPIATLLVQNGTLRLGDIVVAGTSVGKIRVMTDDNGRRIKEAGPSVPVEVSGLDEAPQSGDEFNVASDERLARELVEQRKQKAKESQFNEVKRITLDNLFSTIAEGEVKSLNIIVKADVQGSVEAVRQSLEKLSNNEVKVNVIYGGVGAVKESDVMLAQASDAIIVGFHVRPDPVAQANAEREHVEIRLYRVIYDCIEDVEAAIKGMLAPKYRDIDLGRAEVRNVFKLSSVGTVCGSYVLSGKIVRPSKIRVVRDGIIIAEDEIASLKRFKDDVKEVATGFECGIALSKFNDIKEGDVLESYIIEEYRDK